MLVDVLMGQGIDVAWRDHEGTRSTDRDQFSVGIILDPDAQVAFPVSIASLRLLWARWARTAADAPRNSLRKTKTGRLKTTSGASLVGVPVDRAGFLPPKLPGYSGSKSEIRIAASRRRNGGIRDSALCDVRNIK
ncbi:MAG: hypothetical protein MZW92_08135 [Comamonadaceae bacterium]|nr:hypothetical protein [Comamonadaceae bacterium]